MQAIAGDKVSEENIIELPECGLDTLIGLVKFNKAKEWANSKLNMDIKLSSARGKDSYKYFIQLSVNKFTTNRIKTLLEDPKHEGLYLRVVGGGIDVCEALDNLKKDIKLKGVY